MKGVVVAEFSRRQYWSFPYLSDKFHILFCIFERDTGFFLSAIIRSLHTTVELICALSTITIYSFSLAFCTITTFSISQNLTEYLNPKRRPRREIICFSLSIITYPPRRLMLINPAAQRTIGKNASTIIITGKSIITYILNAKKTSPNTILNIPIQIAPFFITLLSIPHSSCSLATVYHISPLLSI